MTMSEAAQINALLSQSNLATAAEAAEQRRRAQETRELLRMRSQNTLSDGISLAAAKTALDKTNGPFGGNGLANQMYNYLIDPNIPETDPRKIAAHEHLGKNSVQTLPDGTVVERQGIDTYSISGGQRPAQEALGVKPPTAEAARDEIVMGTIGNAQPGYLQPTLMEDLVMMAMPGELQGLVVRDELVADRNQSYKIVDSLLTITSGAAVSDEERRDKVYKYLINSTDGDKTKADKKAEFRRLQSEARQKLSRVYGKDVGVDDDNLTIDQLLEIYQ
jgi:hypothetical protein